MVLKIIWTRNAIEHLEDILNYWEVRNGTNSYSIKLYKLFQNGLDALSRNPLTGTITSNDLIRKKKDNKIFLIIGKLEMGQTLIPLKRYYFVYYSFDESNLEYVKTFIIWLQVANFILDCVIFFAVPRQATLEFPAIFSIRCEQLLAVPSLLSKVFYSILVTDETIQSSCPKLNFLTFTQT